MLAEAPPAKVPHANEVGVRAVEPRRGGGDPRLGGVVRDGIDPVLRIEPVELAHVAGEHLARQHPAGLGPTGSRDQVSELLVGDVAVHEVPQGKPHPTSGRERDGTGLGLRVGVHAERIRQKPARVSRMEVRAARGSVAVHHGHAAPPTVDRARCVAPVGLPSEHALLVAAAVTRQVSPPTFGCEPGGHAEAEAHLLDVREGHSGVARDELRVPVDDANRRPQQFPVGNPDRRPLLADYRRVGAIGRRVEVRDRRGERHAAVSGLGLAVEPDEPHGRLVTPWIMPGQVAEAEHHPGVHGRMVLRIDALARRAGARHHAAIRRTEIPQGRPPDPRVGEHVLDNGLTRGRRDHQPIRPERGHHLGGDPRNRDPRDQGSEDRGSADHASTTS